ncbi:MAG: RNA polymerase sigma factor [Coprobacillaceae bacterium]
MENVGLTQIVRDVQKDITKFDILYQHIEKKVYFWCYTITKNRSDAEDVSQEALMLIYEKINTLKDVEYFNAWIYRIATNCCYMYLRKRKRRDKPFLEDHAFSEDIVSTIPEERIDALPKEIYDVKELKQIISGFITNLPRKQRETITLFYLEEFKVNEIAEILECNTNSVKARLHHGRKNLEKQITEYQDKNNIKLYSIPLLTLLGPSLHSYQQEICAQHQRKSNHTKFNSSETVTFMQSMISAISYKLIALIVIISTAIVSIIIMFHNPENKNYNTMSEILHQSSLNIHKNGYNYILKIDYDSALTRYSIPITITIENTISKEDISIITNNREISFTMNNNKLLLEVHENGYYQIQVKDEILDIEINNIDADAIELIGAYNKESYLQLVLNGESNTIDYINSYITYNNKQYKINPNLTIDGDFKGKIEVTLFDNKGRFVKYSLNL